MNDIIDSSILQEQWSTNMHVYGIENLHLVLITWDMIQVYKGSVLRQICSDSKALML